MERVKAKTKSYKVTYITGSADDIIEYLYRNFEMLTVDGIYKWKLVPVEYSDDWCVEVWYEAKEINSEVVKDSIKKVNW